MDEAIGTPRSPQEAIDGDRSWASSRAVRNVMRGNRKRDTRPEVALRQAVHALRLRYRVACRPFTGAGMADMVFSGVRVAVFLDGCYWHGCPTHFKAPRTNTEYWGAKIERNKARDARTDAVLRAAGWEPLRVWEHEDVSEGAARIAGVVRERFAAKRGGRDG